MPCARERLNREIDEELESHVAEAVERGRDPAEARRAFGSRLRRREESHDLRVLPWLDSLRADAVFGWRQLRKHKVASAAAILSLATGDRRLHFGVPADRRHAVAADACRGARAAVCHVHAGLRSGRAICGWVRVMSIRNSKLMRAAVKEDAELIAISYGQRVELTYGSDQEIERAHRQFVSGWMFDSFGLEPVLGRLFSEADDRVPQAHAYAVLSYDYWTRRFGRDPKVLGRGFRMDSDLYQIVGVAPRGFTGTEPGTMTDIFLPTMMYAGVTHDDWGWIRTFVRMKPGGAVAAVRERLQAVFRAVAGRAGEDFKAGRRDGWRIF